MMTKEELDLVTTDDLIAALHRRFDAHLVITAKKKSETDSERELYFGGGFVHAIGLCEYAKRRLFKMMEGA